MAREAGPALLLGWAGRSQPLTIGLALNTIDLRGAGLDGYAVRGADRASHGLPGEFSPEWLYGYVVTAGVIRMVPVRERVNG